MTTSYRERRRWLLADEASSDLLYIKAALGDVHDQVERIIVMELGDVAVHVEEDNGSQPPQSFVAVNQGMVAEDGLQQRGRLQLDRRVGGNPECR